MERDPASMAALVDLAEAKNGGNQRLLDPKATPENLRTFSYGVGVPCPTRTMTRETAIALKQMAVPMFGSPIYYSPDSLEVGEARNRIVEMALQDKCDYVFFLDYDVAPPANALRKLLALDVPIAAGVYHSKEVPSYPLIMVKGWPCAFEDYEYGDLVKADGVGMGCTLIKTEVFREIERKFGKPWFKTCSGTNASGTESTPHMTEDIYFCEKAAEAGYEIVVDTSIQAAHVDWRTGMIFHYIADPKGGKRGRPGWTYRRNGIYVTETIAAADHPNRIWAKTKPPKVEASTELKIDLGSGAIPIPGFKGVDLHTDGPDVIKGDITDLSWFRREYGFADEINASHCLEHISHRDVPAVFRDWVNTLKPGCKMTVTVPDIGFAAKKILEAVESDNEISQETDYYLMMLYGYQIGEGQEHKNGFTRGRLRQLAVSCGLVDVEINTIQSKGGGWIAPNESLVLTGKRPGGE